MTPSSTESLPRPACLELTGLWPVASRFLREVRTYLRPTVESLLTEGSQADDHHEPGNDPADERDQSDYRENDQDDDQGNNPPACRKLWPPDQTAAPLCEEYGCGEIAEQDGDRIQGANYQTRRDADDCDHENDRHDRNHEE